MFPVPHSRSAECTADDAGQDAAIGRLDRQAPAVVITPCPNLLCGFPGHTINQRLVSILGHDLAATNVPDIDRVGQYLADALRSDRVGFACVVTDAPARQAAGLELIDNIHNGVTV